MNEFGLETGQVWDLVSGSNDDDEMRPCVLLFFVLNNLTTHWRCLDLCEGKLFNASVHRWRDKGKYRNDLGGERLA